MRASAVTLALLAALVVGAPGADGAARAQRPAPTPTIVLSGVSPVAIKGSGFQRRERVRITVTLVGGNSRTKRVRAQGGAFKVTFKHLDGCDGAEADAVGRKGSRASFSFASVAGCP
jgi:hypothetical protein